MQKRISWWVFPTYGLEPLLEIIKIIHNKQKEHPVLRNLLDRLKYVNRFPYVETENGDVKLYHARWKDLLMSIQSTSGGWRGYFPRARGGISFHLYQLIRIAVWYKRWPDSQRHWFMRRDMITERMLTLIKWIFSCQQQNWHDRVTNLSPQIRRRF